jgi:hypothetical protein
MEHFAELQPQAEAARLTAIAQGFADAAKAIVDSNPPAAAGLNSAAACMTPRASANQVRATSKEATRAASKEAREAMPARWTRSVGKQLQEAVDRIFGEDESQQLMNLSFSFTIADPELEGCPLIGCSTGFEELCGYGMHEICGQNCRFLVDPVPIEQQDVKLRQRVRKFCESVPNEQEYHVPADEWESWMPQGRPGDELFCVQKNARKDGTLFNNMFYLKAFKLGCDLDDDKPYIVALQSELPGATRDLGQICQNMSLLDKNMAEVEKVLSALFFVTNCSLHRQEISASNGMY